MGINPAEILAKHPAETPMATDDQLIEPGVWPNFIAPPQYPDPCEGWEDPRLPPFDVIWKVARDQGYAIGLHGSMKRDCDLIAAPWVEHAANPAALILALCEALSARQIGPVEQKPLGRVAVTIQIDGYFKNIDLSIMPSGDTHG